MRGLSLFKFAIRLAFGILCFRLSKLLQLKSEGTMIIRAFTIFLVVITGFLTAADSEPKLKKRQPHWRLEVKETYANGLPKRVLYCNEKAAVKEVILGPEGAIAEEVDLLSALPAWPQGDIRKE